MNDDRHNAIAAGAIPLVLLGRYILCLVFHSPQQYTSGGTYQIYLSTFDGLPISRFADAMEHDLIPCRALKALTTARSRSTDSNLRIAPWIWPLLVTISGY